MTATTTRPTLPDFEDQPVAKATVRITRAGDGLSEALKVEPKALHVGQEVFYVLAGTVEQVNHKADKDGDLTRVHTVAATAVTEIDGGTAQQMLTAAAKALEQRRAELDGQLSIDDELAAEAREAADETDTPSDIAAAAVERVRDGAQ